MQDNSSASPLDHDQPTQTPASTGPHLVIEAAESFNYAAWQNAVPLLRSVVIDNTTGAEFSSLTVEMKASPIFARDKR